MGVYQGVDFPAAWSSRRRTSNRLLRAVVVLAAYLAVRPQVVERLVLVHRMCALYFLLGPRKALARAELFAVEIQTAVAIHQSTLDTARRDSYLAAVQMPAADCSV